MEGYVSDETVEKTREVLANPALREQMVECNYELGRQFFSYALLERSLQALLAEMAGVAR